MQTCSASLSTTNQLSVLHLVSKRYHPADPEPLALRRRDLVADTLARHFSLELGKRPENIQRETAHRGGRIELLCHRHERHPMRVEQLDAGKSASERVRGSTL